MFTGITTAVGRVIEKNVAGDRLSLHIASSYPYPETSIPIGSSISHAGVCLTVASVYEKEKKAIYTVDVSPETCQRTTLAHWDIGTQMNLERPLKIGEALGGHFVTGHIDNVATILERKDLNGGVQFSIKFPKRLDPFIVEKGSITIDGNSLTVNSRKKESFSIFLIPHTLSVTTWSEKQIGDLVNVEIDLLARYASNFLRSSSRR